MAAQWWKLGIRHLGDTRLHYGIGPPKSRSLIDRNVKKTLPQPILVSIIMQS